MYTLAITDQHGSTVDEGTFEEGEILVGRSQGADVVLPSDNVSRKHARIFTVDGRCFVEDLGSSNGVFVNGRRIHEAFEIEGSTQIKVGDYYVTIESQAPEDGVLGRLQGHNLGFAEQTYEIQDAVTLIGRGQDCGLTFVDGSISRAHAKFTFDPSGSVILEDLNSSNGTFVGDEQIQVAPLSDGDAIRFGNAEFTFSLPAASTAQVTGQDFGRARPKSRKGLWITLTLLVVLLATGAVLSAVFWDDMFGAKDEAASVAAADAAEAKKARQKLLEEKEQEEAETLDELRERGQTQMRKEKWTAALSTFKEIIDLTAGDEDAEINRNRVQEALRQKKELQKAQDLIAPQGKDAVAKPGAAAKLLRKEILNRKTKTVYGARAETLLKGLREGQMVHMIEEAKVLRKRNARSCQNIQKRIVLYGTIIDISRDVSQARKDARAGLAEDERLAKKRNCK